LFGGESKCERGGKKAKRQEKGKKKRGVKKANWLASDH